MIQAPHHEVPIRAMPEPAERHRGDRVEHAARQAEAISAERNVHVVANPQTERHVPALPELHRRAGDVGPIKVFRNDDAHHAGEADRHVAIAAEVEQDARRKRDEKEPAHADALRRILRLEVVDPAGEVVGGPLLHEADRDARQADHRVVCGWSGDAGVHGRHELLIALDRARDHRGPEQREPKIISQLHDRRTAAKPVNQIVNELECEEADAERDRDREIGLHPGVQSNAGFRRDAPDEADGKKGGVLECRQHCDTDGDRRDDRGPVTGQSRQIGDDRKQKDRHDADPATVMELEQQTPDDHQAQPHGRPWDHEIEREERKREYNKLVGEKDHFPHTIITDARDASDRRRSMHSPATLPVKVSEAQHPF